MRLNGLNSNNSKKSALVHCFSFVVIANLAIFSNLSHSNDLLPGAELKDSPLSLSLTTTAIMTVGDQTHQLVINQYGINNKAIVNQIVNTENSIAIEQYGIDNLADLTQLGYGNTINLQQQGDSNFAEVKQDGNANIANIIQEGEQSFIVHQIGNNMIVNITQF